MLLDVILPNTKLDIVLFNYLQAAHRYLCVHIKCANVVFLDASIQKYKRRIYSPVSSVAPRPSALQKTSAQTTDERVWSFFIFYR